MLRKDELSFTGLSGRKLSCLISDMYSPDYDLLIGQNDSLEFLKKVPDKSVKLIVTSPPYNIGKVYEYRIKLPFGNGAFREMDFVKNRLGVEVQFGKYAFMAYNVSAKMTIFHNHNIIDAGIEIVPMKNMAEQMSSGVSYFEQIKWDLENRGVADIDIPVIVMGIDG